MGPLALPFIILPGAAAIAVGWAIADWRLAGAVAAGAPALLYLLPQIGIPPTIFMAPVLAGIAGLVLLPALLIWPDLTVWARMTLALAAAVAAGLLLITANSGVA